MSLDLQKAPHWLGTMTVPVMMQQVILAMLPVCLAMIWLLGIGVLLNILFATAVCVLLEALMLRMRGQPVQLFLSGARRLCPGFRIADQQEHVARICQLVDGVPLGILLAAAWMPVLTPAEIAGRLSGDAAF